MSNRWLVPLAKGLGVGGLLGIPSRNMREIIREGADVIMKQRRTDLFPRFIHEVPDGVAIINDVHAFEAFLAGIVAASAKLEAWQSTRFAYEAKGYAGLIYTRPWQEFTIGLARHDCHPVLFTERDLYVFANRDWHVGYVKIAIGLA